MDHRDGRDVDHEQRERIVGERDVGRPIRPLDARGQLERRVQGADRDRISKFWTTLILMDDRGDVANLAQ